MPSSDNTTDISHAKIGSLSSHIGHYLEVGFPSRARVGVVYNWAFPSRRVSLQANPIKGLQPPSRILENDPTQQGSFFEESKDVDDVPCIIIII